MKERETGETTYSEEFPGDKRNWDWPVRFDFTDGYLGITQTAGSTERVLLARSQLDELVRFVRERRERSE